MPVLRKCNIASALRFPVSDRRIIFSVPTPGYLIEATGSATFIPYDHAPVVPNFSISDAMELISFAWISTA